MAKDIIKKTTTIKKTVKPAEIKKPELVKPKVQKTEQVLVKCLNKDIKISPRKLRLLANDIKKINPHDAVVKLPFINCKAARVILPVVKNVIADAKNNFNLNPDSLKFYSIRVDEGLKIKRMDKAHGYRFSRGVIQKRHSRLEIIVSGEKNGSKS